MGRTIYRIMALTAVLAIVASSAAQARTAIPDTHYAKDIDPIFLSSDDFAHVATNSRVMFVCCVDAIFCDRNGSQLAWWTPIKT